MAGWLRLIGVLLIVGPFSAMFAEPFFAAVLDQLGVDTEDWAAPVVSTIFDIFSAQWFRLASLAMIGVGFGIWLHWLAVRYDRRTSSTKDEKDKRGLAAALDNYYVEGVALRNALGQIADLDQYLIERSTLVDWSDRTRETLNNHLVTVKEISDFRTLNLFEPTRPGHRPVPTFNEQLRNIWDEKLKRLKFVIDRLGS